MLASADGSGWCLQSFPEMLRKFAPTNKSAIGRALGYLASILRAAFRARNWRVLYFSRGAMH